MSALCCVRRLSAFVLASGSTFGLDFALRECVFKKNHREPLGSRNITFWAQEPARAFAVAIACCTSCKMSALQVDDTPFPQQYRRSQASNLGVGGCSEGVQK